MAKPNYSQPLAAITDASEVTVTAKTFCAAVYVNESPAASGWPRGFLVRLTVAGSVQHNVAAGGIFRAPGPFQPGDTVCTVELVSAGGDSSNFQVQELMG